VERFDRKDSRPPQREWARRGQLEGESRGRFCWWRPRFRCQELEEEVDQEDMQDGERHIDIPGVAQESPLLEASLIALADTLVEGVSIHSKGHLLIRCQQLIRYPVL